MPNPQKDPNRGGPHPSQLPTDDKQAPLILPLTAGIPYSLAFFLYFCAKFTLSRA